MACDHLGGMWFAENLGLEVMNAYRHNISPFEMHLFISEPAINSDNLCQ